MIYSSNAPLVKIDVCLFANNVRVSPANALDLCQSVHDLAFAIHVGIKQTQDVLLYD
jgi:hypothetical protein